TMTFFSDLKLFPEQGVGIFVARDGIGEIKSRQEIREIPDPAIEIAERFLPKAPEAAPARDSAFSGGTEVAGIYHSSRRAESSWLRVLDLLSQSVVKSDGAGNVRMRLALWLFGDGEGFKRVEPNLYEGRASVRLAFVNDVGSEPYLAHPSIR